MRPLIAIDYDGTLTENTWPKHGDWRPGAVDALRELVKFARVTIFTMRVSPYEIDGFTERTRVAVEIEKRHIEDRLRDIGVPEVTVWMKLGKPPAIAFIDDRGIHYNGRAGAWAPIVTRCKIMCKEVRELFPEYGELYEPIRDTPEVVR